MTVMLLAAVGVYGIVAFITRASGAEFALRMALGARGGARRPDRSVERTAPGLAPVFRSVA